MTYAAEADLLCYPGTTVLKNLLDIQDQAELDEATREATARYYAEDRHRSGSVAEMTVDALAAGLIGLLSLGWGGSSSGGGASSTSCARSMTPRPR